MLFGYFDNLMMILMTVKMMTIMMVIIILVNNVPFCLTDQFAGVSSSLAA